MNIKIEIIKLKDENIWNHHFSKDLLYGSKHLIIKERKNVKIEKINALKLYQSNAWMCTREMKICCFSLVSNGEIIDELRFLMQQIFGRTRKLIIRSVPKK